MALTGVCVVCLRDAKTKVLKSIPPIKPDDMLIGQYTASDDQGEKKKGYTDDPSVPNKHSLTATFAVTELHVNNERCASGSCVVKSTLTRLLVLSLNSLLLAYSF